MFSPRHEVSQSPLRTVWAIQSSQRAFTLIELAVVIIIIGLVVGGILVGRDLVVSSEVQAQISQINKYQLAVNTFKAKYGYLPGDIIATDAAQFGFLARGSARGQGDGNGLIEGNYDSGTGYSGVFPAGETVLFWEDLSAAKMVDTYLGGVPVTVWAKNVVGGVGSVFPKALIGKGNYVYVYSLGQYSGSGWSSRGIHYFGVSVITGFTTGSTSGEIAGTLGLTVKQAYDIDKKVDDGSPLSGKVQTLYVDSGKINLAGTFAGSVMDLNVFTDPNYQNYPSSTTCFDNGGTWTRPQQYSVGVSNGDNKTCALSFQF